MDQQPPTEDRDMPDPDMPDPGMEEPDLQGAEMEEAGDPDLRDRARLTDFYDGALELAEDRAIRARLAHDPRARRILAEIRAVQEFEGRLRAAFHATPRPEQRNIMRRIGLDPALLEGPDPRRSGRIAASTTYVRDPQTAREDR